MAEQRRSGEGYGAYKARRAKAGSAAGMTAKQKAEAAHAPWRKKWEAETGQKYGIATASKYNTWLAEQRKKREAEKAKPTLGDMLK